MVKVIKKKMSTEEKRKKERDRKRKYREKLKDNQEKQEKVKEYDRNRKQKDKEEGKIKTISDMSNREKRVQRKKWREATSKSRKHKEALKNAEHFVEENTPPGSPASAFLLPQGSSESRKIAGQRRSRKRRDRDAKEIRQLKESLEKAKKKTDKWRKKYQRQKKKIVDASEKNSPGKIADKILHSGPDEIRRNLITGAALRLQLQENSANCKSQEEKKTIARNIFGPVISKKKDAKEALKKENILSPYYQRQANKIIKKRKKRATHISDIRHMVIDFFEDNENSSQAPGKKDYITRQNVQKQKRYLLLPIKELYKKFIQKNGMVKISYQTFIRIKPFWIVHKKLNQRDTCLCKTHANFKFKLDKLKLLRIIKTNSTSQVLRETVCKTDEMSCMFNTCSKCKLKISENLLVNDTFEDFNTFFYRWVDKKEEYKSKKSDKMIQVKRTVKEKVLCKASELLKETNKDLKTIAVHVFNMVHQHQQFTKLKQELEINEAAIICDWSENYNCKYGEEVQAIHFGASRKQIALHTGIVYLKIQNGEDKIIPFCTISNATNHEAPAVWAHLKPILELLKNKHPNVNVLHFFTDGPTGQYRNKTNFLLMCEVCSNLNFDLCAWNFWEAGHGKGAADGIGGLVKRTCDRAVAMGKDVTDSEVVLSTINHLNIVSFLIDESKIREMEQTVEKTVVNHKLLPIPETMKLKSVIWNKEKPTFFLRIRRLSCSACRLLETCTHYLFKFTSEWTLLQPNNESTSNNKEFNPEESGSEDSFEALDQTRNIAMDWSDHALWWPARNSWLTRTRSTIDQYGVQADALLHFTPMHKTLRVQLPDLRYLDCRVDFSIKTFNSVINLCKELGIRHPEELSFCKPLEPNHLKYNLKDMPSKKREMNGTNGKMIAADTNTFIANQSPAGSTGSLDKSQPFMCAPVTPKHYTSTPISSPMGTSATWKRNNNSELNGSYTPALNGNITTLEMLNGSIDSSLALSPAPSQEARSTLLRPKTLVEKARMNVGWLDSSLSIMEQGVREFDTLRLRFKFFSFYDLNPKTDVVRINQIYEQAKWMLLNEELDCTEEEALMFAALQVQVNLQAAMPQPSLDNSSLVSAADDEIDAALTDLQVSLEGSHISGTNDITQVPELYDYLRFLKPKRFTLKAFKRYWFTCRDLHLKLYKSREDCNGGASPVLDINLRGCEVTPEVNLSQGKYSIKLEVASPEGMSEMYIRCDSESQYAKWMAACRLAAKGRSLADASYEAEVVSIQAFLQMQHPAPMPAINPASLDITPEDYVAPRYAKKLKGKLVQRILEAHANVKDLALVEAKLHYIKAWQSLPDFGISLFVVKFMGHKKEELVGVAFNRLMRMEINTGDHIKTWTYNTMKAWNVNWEVKHMMVQFEEGNIIFACHSADCKVIHEFIGGYIFLSMRSKEANQSLNQDLFHKLTGGWV